MRLASPVTYTVLTSYRHSPSFSTPSLLARLRQFFASLKAWVSRIDSRDIEAGTPLKRTPSFVGEGGTVVRRPSFLLNEMER